MKVFFASFAFFAYINMFAQTHQYTKNFNTWYAYSGDHNITNKIGIHLEGQLRINDGVMRFQQNFFRTGVNYYFKNAFATVGYAFTETFPYGEFAVKHKFPEHRIWQQVQVKSQIDRFEIINRFRLEQRFSKLPVLHATNNLYEVDDAIYTNRFRYMGKISIPFKGKQIVDKSFYAYVYDEFFINFGKNVKFNIFDQNRLGIGLGYKIPNLGKLEIGYLFNTVNKSDGIKIEKNHTLQVGITSNISFMKKKKE
jgi:hypothetical protein